MKKTNENAAKAAKVNEKAPLKGEVKKPAPQKEKPSTMKSSYGYAVTVMCSNPDTSIEDLMKEVNKEIGDAIVTNAVRTAYSQVRKIVVALKQNGWTNPKSK